MAPTSAAASYKKQDGYLQYDDTSNTVSWTPTTKSSSVSAIPIKVQNITNLQQTPASSAKVALKIAASSSDSSKSEPENYVFNFTARSDQEAITSVLRNAITTNRASAASSLAAVPEPTTSDETGQSAAMAISQAVRSNSRATESWYDDKRLVADHKLQRSLFDVDPELRERFERSLAEKPESMTPMQFSTQFWSSRTHLLRAHAIEQQQSQGSYNVLAQVKDTTVDGARKLSLTKEHIRALFNQHPVILHAYNDNVPNKLSESEFWMRFFNSKLLRKLKGEPITDAIPTDHILDRYLAMDSATLSMRTASDPRVPHFIDLEGNEQNHSQRKGNQADWTMRPEASGKVPILQILNNMSEKIMANVTPADSDPYATATTDEGTYEELRIRDLQNETTEDRVKLNVKEQKHRFAGGDESGASAEARWYEQLDASTVLNSLIKQVERNPKLDPSGGSESNSRAASSQIMSLIRHQKELSSGEGEISNLSADVFQSLLLTHNTSSEFLHYFWTTLLANPNKPTYKLELSSLSATLSKSAERIAAVAETAEKERQAKFAELKRNALEYQSKTGKKRKVDESMVTIGGKKDVEGLMGPTLTAVQFAQEKYAAL